MLAVASGLVSEGEAAAAAEEWLTGCNLPSPRSDQTAAWPRPYLPMECNSCAGARQGGLAESPLTDPQRRRRRRRPLRRPHLRATCRAPERQLNSKVS